MERKLKNLEEDKSLLEGHVQNLEHKIETYQNKFDGIFNQNIIS